MLNPVRQTFLLAFLVFLMPMLAPEARAEGGGAPVAAEAKGRYALVIGNSAYTGTSPLKNPVNDAKLMGDTLKQTGFKVQLLLDASRPQMRQAMLQFGRSLRGDPGSVGLFYYAGHGLQVKGVNYVVPVTADIRDEEEVPFHGIDVNEFLRTMHSAQSRLNIVVLDACRNNPYARAFRSATRGLAPVRAASGTLIAYSTSPGDVAFDGKGLNSPYTLALSRFLRTPGVTVERVFKKVLAAVEDETDRKQTPWLTGAFRGDFYFVKKGKKAAQGGGMSAGMSGMAGGKPDRSEMEKLFWESIANSSNPASFQAYLSTFPNGVFAPLAKLKIAELSARPTDRVASSRPPPRTQEPASPGPGGQQTGALAPATDSATRQLSYRYVFPDSSRRELAAAEVKNLDCHKLWLARNEIYYRNGYCFKSEKGIRYFDNSSCSQARVTLKSLESRNVRTFRTWEIRKRCLVKNLRG